MYIAELKKMVSNLPDKPFLVDIETVRSCKTYREACVKAWELKWVKNMKISTLAELGEFYPQHVSCWLNKNGGVGQKELPGKYIAQFEVLVGNHLVTQWLALQAGYVLAKEFI